MSAFVGALIGTSVSVMSNGLRRIPVMAKPHGHLLGFAIGGVLGYKFTDAKEWSQDIMDFEKQKARRAIVERR